MRDIIQKIVAAENEARLIVEEAGVEAERILSDARKQGQALIEGARREGLTQAGRIVEAATEEAEKEKERRLSLAAGEIDREVRLETDKKESVIEGVVRCVCRLP